jgi:nucleoside-diphosphate-sugar epimerase
MNRSTETVVVTGAAGLIGSALCKRLAKQYAVVGLYHEGSRHAQPPLSASVGVEMTSDASVHHAFEQVRAIAGQHLTSVIHLAAFYDFDGKPSPLYDQLTVQGTHRVLTELSSFQVDQFLFSSTMLVHAPCEPGEQINEDWPLEPKWPYPQSKVKAEQVIQQAHGTIPTVVLRIAGVYDDQCHSIPIAHQIQRIYERQLISHVFSGDLSHGQDFVHTEDLVDSIVLAIERRQHLPTEVVMLIGEDQVLSYGELQQRIGQGLYHEEWITERIPKEAAKVGAWIEEELPLGEEPFIKPWMIDIADDHYALDCTRAHQMLGWVPRHTLGETLPVMLRALQDDPLAWYQVNRLVSTRPFHEQPASDAHAHP